MTLIHVQSPPKRKWTDGPCVGAVVPGRRAGDGAAMPTQNLYDAPRPISRGGAYTGALAVGPSSVLG